VDLGRKLLRKGVLVAAEEVTPSPCAKLSLSFQNLRRRGKVNINSIISRSSGRGRSS
jgi:hypothetical protein